MGLFTRKDDYTPSDAEVRAAARKLQQGGSRREAERLTRKSGSQSDATAGRILSAASEIDVND
ncbi:hypothetical protein GCM10009837_07330 [Streptomyces durmitorensis]|uniref:Uncharacterized protein n=1 Tax=Streptomyces durmitorensis TaxID=319947 RepID=A0ABY4PKV3_9ACTN|nr:hypothetical protein [Streptomyces durmitorensis]UQT54375.1 hypothetical protein M4V62_04330 [Streptomyces durmitorensis]